MSRAPLFDSTVAVSLYNMLCREGELPVESLYLLAVSKQHPQLEKSQALRCLDELGARALVVRTGNGFKVADPQRRPVLFRRNTDSAEDLGTAKAGWSGWFVKDGNQNTPIEKALGLEPPVADESGGEA